MISSDTLLQDPDDEDLPARPDLFIDNLLDGIEVGANKKVDGGTVVEVQQHPSVICDFCSVLMTHKALTNAHYDLISPAPTPAASSRTS